jgi:hypothetical protein
VRRSLLGIVLRSLDETGTWPTSRIVASSTSPSSTSPWA